MLIVEDDLTTANALLALLSHRGYDVKHTSTLADAMRQIDNSLHAVVLDLMLPDGDGAAVLEYVRKAGLGTKVLVTTGVSDHFRIELLNQLEPTLILKKPINLSELLRGLAH